MTKILVETASSTRLDLLANYDHNVAHITKYMGSKRRILDFVIGSINDVYQGGGLCDLFAGTSILSGALGKLIPIHSNDIQEYSAILSHTYLSNYEWSKYSSTLLDDILHSAKKIVDEFKVNNAELSFAYPSNISLDQFIQIENEQQKLLERKFNNSYHLFTKYYSGTYWSYEQCLWIDAIRRVADNYKETSVYYIILSSLIYSMSYCSQSTGHYAQYRDAKSESSKNDILIYRTRKIRSYFVSKFNQFKDNLTNNKLKHRITSLDYRDCLEIMEPGSLVYADPPYAFVHYSRFYHAIETLVKYDYPKIDHKGRYRTDRHQSPFGRTKEVNDAFFALFQKIEQKKSNLILSYSNTGMITLDTIVQLARKSLGNNYELSCREQNYKHSTMGRNDDKNKEVKEYLIIAKMI